MSLDELPIGRGNMAQEASFSCSHLCEATENALAQVGGLADAEQSKKVIPDAD